MSRLIITGFARSGTSILTKFLNLCGYDTGGSWNPELDAGFEDEYVQSIVTTFQRNTFQEDLILFLEKEIEKIDKLVIKHPRFLYVPELLRIWQTIFPDISILLTYRTPLHSLQSKMKHSSFGYYTNLSPAELDKKFHDFVDLLIHLKIKHHILYFPEFLENYNEVFHSINSLGIYIDKEKGLEIWKSIIDFKKVHYK